MPAPMGIGPGVCWNRARHRDGSSRGALLTPCLSFSITLIRPHHRQTEIRCCWVLLRTQIRCPMAPPPILAVPHWVLLDFEPGTEGGGRAETGKLVSCMGLETSELVPSTGQPQARTPRNRVKTAQMAAFAARCSSSLNRHPPRPVFLWFWAEKNPFSSFFLPSYLQAPGSRPCCCRGLGLALGERRVI